MSKLNLLRSPDGKRTWRPEDKVQEVNLLAQGWKPEPNKKQAPAPANKSATPKPNK